jgi:uncharacterized membrane protein
MSERPHPRSPGLVGTLASVAGICVSAYLTYEHYTGSQTLVCSSRGLVDCLGVTTSSYSKIVGIPVADLGLLFFGVMLGLQLPVTWNRVDPVIRRARVSWALVGVGSAVYLVCAELFLIDAICLWCTAVHVLVFVVFASTVFGTLATAPPSCEALVVPTAPTRWPRARRAGRARPVL